MLLIVYLAHNKSVDSGPVIIPYKVIDRLFITLPPTIRVRSIISVL